VTSFGVAGSGSVRRVRQRQGWYELCGGVSTVQVPWRTRSVSMVSPKLWQRFRL